MKILAFADPHSHEEYLKQIKLKSKNVDIVICAGDLTWFNKNIKKLLKKLNTLKKPVYIINGNHENTKEMAKLCKPLKNVHFMHKKTLRIDNNVFLFFGNDGLSPNEPQFFKFSKKEMKKTKKTDQIILVTHGPPSKTKLDLLPCGHVGCKDIKEFILKYKPVLHISGHLHEHFGTKQLLKKTLMINPGPSGRILKV